MAGTAQTEANRMITIHGYSPSGNCHKLRMLLAHLGRRLDHDFRWIETDSAHGATRTPEYLAKNPNGKVPLLERDAGLAGGRHALFRRRCLAARSDLVVDVLRTVQP